MDKASIAIAKIMRLTEYVITAGIARERSKTYFAVKESPTGRISKHGSRLCYRLAWNFS